MTTSGVSPLALTTPRSGIREVLELALSMGDDVIHLELGEPSFNTPEHVIDAASQALHDGWTRYTSNEGVPALREALAAKLRRVNGINADPDQILVTSGAVEGLYSTLFALCDEGDEILIPDPGWSNYMSMAHLIRAKAVGYQLGPDNGFLPDVAELEQLLTPRTRVLLINSPSNPIGTIIGRERMVELIEFAKRHEIWLLSDECYDQLTFEDGFVSAAAISDYERIVTAHSFSKTYAMTGWRIGYMTLPKGMPKIVARIHEPIVSCVSAVGQAAAIAAVNGPQDCVTEMRNGYLERRDKALAVLNAHNVPVATVPAGAFYLWLDLRSYVDDVKQFSLDLLSEEKVAIAPGTAFGRYGEGFVRISFGGDADKLETGLDRLGKFLNRNR